LASALLFFGYVRLGVAYLPVIWILQALAIGYGLGALSAAPVWQRRFEIATLSVMGLLLLSDYSSTSTPRVLMIDGLVDEQGRLVEDQRMELVRVK
jgi:hypothetical protein